MAKKKAQQEVALEVVCNIGRAVATEMELVSLLELIYRETGRVMDTDCFTMGLYDPLEQGLRFELLYDRADRLPPMVLRKEDGWGLAGRVFEERSALLFEDLASDLPKEAILLGEAPRSWLGVPLIARERAIGVISVQSYEAKAFGPANQHLLEAIASQAAVAIENLFLRREQERRIAELSALSEIGRAIITAAGVEELLDIIYRETSRVMDTANLYVALFHSEEGLVTFDYFMQDGQRVDEPPVRLEEGGLSVHIINSRQPLLLGEDAPREMSELGINLVGRPAQSYLGVPMLAGDRVVGVIAVQSPDHPRAYDRRHQDLLSNIANLAAMAIENARLTRERERRITELSILNEISQAISSTMTMDEMLETVYRQVGRVFDAANFYIALYNAERDEVTFALDVLEGQLRRTYTARQAGRGLTEYIIRSRAPLLIPRNVDEKLQEIGIELIGRTALSWLGVPLVTGDRVVGVMAVQSYTQPDVYGEQDLSLFSTIAGQAAIALENTRLLQELQQRLADLTVLNEVSQAMLVAESEDELLEAIHRQVGRVMDTTHFYMALYDKAKQEIDFAYFIENGERTAGPGRIPISVGGLTVHIIQQREPLFLMEDIDGWLENRGIPMRGQKAASFMGVPMTVGEQVIGAMAVQSYSQERAYTTRHFALLNNIATQAAIAVQRIRLRASEARKGQQLAIIGEVGRKVTAILDLDQLLRELARAIQLGFGYSDVAVFRVDDAAQELVLGALVGRYAGIIEWGYRQPIGEGLPGWTARKGQAVTCNDVLQEPRYVRGFDAEELSRSELCVPISFANRVIGVLDIQSEEEEAFDPEDVSAMETLAGQLAAAMRNAILFRERGEQLANLNALNRVIQSTATAISLDELLTSLCDVVVELMSPDGFFVALRDRATGKLVAPLLMDEAVFYRNVELSDSGYTAYTLSAGQPLLIRTLAEAGKYPIDRSTALIGSGREAPSWLGVPFRSGEEMIGCISVQSYRPHAFDEQDVEFLQSVASQVVVNIEKARLFEETQRALVEVRESSARQQQLLTMIQELSTPLVPVTEEILILPLVGTIDSQRAQQIMDVLLEGISNRRARVVIMDITGVPVVDTSVANYLLQATQAVRLLGAECILVGITPEVAETVVGLGVQLQGLTTRSDLQGGIEHALRLVGQRIVKPTKRAPRQAGTAPAVRKPKPVPPFPGRS